ncbi:VanZ like family protein [Evansella caseinilytica]|uniref:VanZ like family protein n=1 Tax=Evansella caseinilytica TaxID=1503961 RepID=A0A1H3V0L2_9BACI|nr:VanZ family protein [Evansella caseinilytica]SDZ68157.1 VanZ like family protein [Evansella caseinilytica]
MRNKNNGKKKYNKSFPLAPWLLFIYLIMLFYITLFAWNYGASFGQVGPGGRNYNLKVFYSIYRIAVYSKDIGDPIRILLGNIVLFIPFGFLFPMFLERFRQSKKPVGIILVTFIAMLLSCSIEMTQFIFTYRVANIDDVILNTTGGFIGVIMYRIVRMIKII